jgi:hypothetical protein
MNVMSHSNLFNIQPNRKLKSTPNTTHTRREAIKSHKTNLTGKRGILLLGGCRIGIGMGDLYNI